MSTAPPSSLTEVADLLQRLERARLYHTLSSVREGAVMIQVAVPGARWEIEFFADRPPEIEVFSSNGQIVGREALNRLFEQSGG